MLRRIHGLAVELAFMSIIATPLPAANARRIPCPVHLLCLALLFSSWFAVGTAVAEQADIRFVVLGKTANYRQQENTSSRLLNYHFFAEIFLRDGGRVSNPVLLLPGEKELLFSGSDSVLEAHGGRYNSEKELDRYFPNGAYIFSYRLSDRTLINQSVVLDNATGGSRIPEPVRISLFQEDKVVRADRVDPAKDLLLRWSDFKTGNRDPNGIVDDLVFVVTGNCHGERINHSGGPFSDSPYLTFADREYRIPAGSLAPGEPHQLFIEHAEMDTSVYRAIPEIATYAATTFLDIHTTGTASAKAKTCPQPMTAMDGGQTDRPQAPDKESR